MISISIIIPVYNVEDYLEDCLTSILQQDFEDYEIICINDAATDDSEKILEKYAKQYNQIRIITHLENQGLSAARNTGLKEARGKYIWFIDADDLITPHSFAEIYNIAEEKRTDIIYFDFVRICDGRDYRNVSEKKKHIIISEKPVSGKKFFCEFVATQMVTTTACAQFIRKDFLIENNIEFYKGILHEDELFCFLTLMSAQIVLKINKTYYLYRQRTGSIMDNKNFKRAESLFVVLIQILTYWNSHPFTEEEHKAIGDHFEKLFRAYQYYNCFGEKTKELSVGREIERRVYKILQEKNKRNYLTLNEKQIRNLKKVEHVIVFGCGKAAYEVISILKENGINIDSIIVSRLEGNPELFCGIKVDTADHIMYDLNNTMVVLGVTKTYRLGIYEELEKLGFRNIIIPESIKRVSNDTGNSYHTDT